MKNFDKIGLMLDCSRNAVPTVKTVKTLLGYMAKMGYNRLQLYTEDTFEVQNQPYFGYLRGRYSQQELKEIDAYALSKGIELMPCVQVLAHLNQIFKWDCFKEVQDCNDILLIDEEKTYQLLDNIFASLANSFTSRNVNIGCDEAWQVGLGKYLERHGYQNRLEIMNRHVGRVLQIADKYGFKCSMWSDMYFHLAFGAGYYNTEGGVSKQALSQVPANLNLIFWDYWHTDASDYNRIFTAHREFSNEIEFACGAWKWTGFASDNAYSFKATGVSVPLAREFGIKNIMITAWGDDGAEASPFSVLPALYYFSRLCQGKSVEGAEFEAGFKRLTGVDFARFLDIEIISHLAWGAEGKRCSAEKYFLYNDYFLGIMDKSVTGKEAEHYRQVADRLSAGKYGKFSYLFKTMQLLAEVLELKADIGVRTRQAYIEGNKDQLLKIAQQYAQIAQRLEAFYKAFSSQWHRENKPFGFEVQDMRLGGLIKRTHACRKRLLDYCAGRVSNILELEEDILPFAEAGTGCGYAHLEIVSPNRT